MKILSIAPTRLSLFGGGTDLEVYSHLYGGLCINMSMNIRQKVELNDEVIGHKLPIGASYEFNKIIFSEMKQPLPSGIFCEFDGIIESGLGSSASAAVALIGAINKMSNLGMSREDIAEKAWDIEVNKIGLFGGKQDQYAAAFGGVNLMEFGKKVTLFSLSRNLIESFLPSLVLFYLGKNRQSAVIQEGFKNPTTEQVNALHKIKKLAQEAFFYLYDRDIIKIGALLNETWHYKKMSNKGVSNEKIDKVYEVGIKAGAWGGKVMGAGGGGHMFFICPSEKREKLIKKMAELGVHEVDFSIDWNGLEVRRL